MVIFADFLSISLSYFKESTGTKDFEERGRNILKYYYFQAKQCIWGDTVFKSGHGQFWNLRTLTEMYSAEDRKYFLLTHLILLPVFDCSNS